MTSKQPTPELELDEATREAFVRVVMMRYRALFDSNMLGVAATDFNDTILSANDAFLQMIGYTQNDLQDGTLTWSKITPSKFEETDNQKVEELLTNKAIIPFEKEYIHKKGHIVPVLVGAESFDDAITHGVCFALDISELKLLEQKKDDFIGMVSHELKTPLSIMKLYADDLTTALHDKADTNTLLESAQEISTQVDKLSVLITDLLNMARYQAHEGAFPVNAINLTDCAQRVVSEIRLLSDRTIVFDSEKPVFVMGNFERISQVIRNLIHNAIRYSEETSQITVRVQQSEDAAHIEVQDFGIGISPEDQEKIFDRFYRIDHADAYSEKGAGIGLYVSNEIVKYHKGTIEVESELGIGTTFRISIPRISRNANT